MNPCIWRFFVNLPSENHEIPQVFSALSMRRNDALWGLYRGNSAAKIRAEARAFANDRIAVSHGDPASRFRDYDWKRDLATLTAASAMLCNGRLDSGS